MPSLAKTRASLIVVQAFNSGRSYFIFSFVNDSKIGGLASRRFRQSRTDPEGGFVTNGFLSEATLFSAAVLFRCGFVPSALLLGGPTGARHRLTIEEGEPI
jgi:hypothetical protein